MKPQHTNLSRHHQGGQALIEAMVVLLAVVVMLMPMFFTIYALASRFWLQHCTYQAALCLTTPSSIAYCRTRFYDMTYGFFGFAHSEPHIDLVRNREDVVATSSYELMPVPLTDRSRSPLRFEFQEKMILHKVWYP